MQAHLLKDKIYYRTNEFKPDRPTLVFAHGVSGSSSAWLPYEKNFENKYNILTYDIRGHGLSKKFPNYSDYEVRNFVQDLHELVSDLGIKKFVFISNSFAALIHLEYLKLYRDTVVANVFTSPEVFFYKDFASKVFRYALAPITGLISILPFNAKPRGQVDYSKHIGSTDWDIKRNLADMRNTGLRAHFYTLRHSFNQKSGLEIEKINVPTLVIHGENDTMVPMKNAIMLSEKIKGAEFKNVPNVDHNTVHNGVPVMTKEIEAFLDKNKGVLY